MTYLFSVITVCLNARDDLLLTAKSLDGQVFRDFEWIVIDGGSSDGTLEFLSKCKSIAHWKSEPDEGIADAWNKGIALSSGSQILILNAGDVYSKNMLLIMSQYVSEDNITCCHARICGSNKQSIFYAKPNLLWRGMHVPHNWCSVPLSKYKLLGLYKKIAHSMDFEWFARYYKMYGVGGFNVINQVLGEYALGGHSDVYYVHGFKENERILICYGMNPIKAKLIRFNYTFKHFVRYRIRKILGQ